MNILKQWVLPIVAGFLVASIIMIIFEWINHFFVPPPPAALDQHLGDLSNLHAYTASLPWTAYILVFVGWAFGAFEGGCTTAWLAGEKQLPATTILAVLLVLAGIFDMLAIGFPMIAMMLGVVILAVSPFLGRLAMNTFMERKMAAMAATRGV